MARLTKAEIQRRAELRLFAGPQAANRYAELQVDLVAERDTVCADGVLVRAGELILRAGGRWDRLRGEYVDGVAETSRVLRLHPGQVDGARWFAWWLEHHMLADLDETNVVYDMLCAGGRRGGKTDWIGDAIAVYAVAHPGSLIWIVVPTEGFESEPMRYIESKLPRDWYKLHEASSTYYLINGTTIVLQSAKVPRKLKQGKADFIVINEGQACPTQSYDTLSASIVDSGGLIITAANPPDIGDPGEWVAKLAGDALTEANPHARYFFYNPEKNPHIDQSALRALRKKWDRRTYRIQALGEFLLAPNVVLHAWSRTENERPIPRLGRDVTRRFTKFFEGREYTDIVGVDVQSYPWIVGVRFKAYENPKAPGDMTEALLWGVDEVFLEEGDETQFAHALDKLGLDPQKTLIICDATARWQQAERDPNKQRAEFKGKGSWDMLSAAGYRNIVGPDPKLKTNPDVHDRWRAGNARIEDAEGEDGQGERRLFLDPQRCKQACESVRSWKHKDGKPIARNKGAHAGDAITYVVWRFFPRRIEKDTVEHTKIPRAQRGSERTKGFQ